MQNERIKIVLWLFENTFTRPINYILKQLKMKKLLPVLAAIILAATSYGQFEAKKATQIGQAKVPGLTYYTLTYTTTGTDTLYNIRYHDMLKSDNKNIKFSGAQKTLDDLSAFLIAETKKEKGTIGEFELGNSTISYKVKKILGTGYLECDVNTQGEKGVTRFTEKLIIEMFTKQTN